MARYISRTMSISITIWMFLLLQMLPVYFVKRYGHVVHYVQVQHVGQRPIIKAMLFKLSAIIVIMISFVIVVNEDYDCGVSCPC